MLVSASMAARAQHSALSEPGNASFHDVLVGISMSFFALVTICAQRFALNGGLRSALCDAIMHYSTMFSNNVNVSDGSTDCSHILVPGQTSSLHGIGRQDLTKDALGKPRGFALKAQALVDEKPARQKSRNVIEFNPHGRERNWMTSPRTRKIKNGCAQNQDPFSQSKRRFCLNNKLHTTD